MKIGDKVIWTAKLNPSDVCWFHKENDKDEYIGANSNCDQTPGLTPEVEDSINRGEIGKIVASVRDHMWEEPYDFAVEFPSLPGILLWATEKDLTVTEEG